MNRKRSSLDDLSRDLALTLPSTATGDLLVAFSGGLDSTVLLHALARSAGRHVRAVHIDHGLHADAKRWEAHAEHVAAALGVEFESHAVRVPSNPPEGIESAARQLRYAVFRERLRPGETLLTAHHADDQLETVLLALLRGSGVDGLAAMPRCQPFGAGWHMRPLLEYTRDELEAWAVVQELTWLDDPSNEDTRFDRNYIRNAVVPLLRNRWPSVAHSIVRTASHLGEASDLLDEIAARDLSGATIGSCLKVSALQALDGPRRRNLLRHWLKSCGARAPSTRKLAALEHDMLAAEDDRMPCVEWDDIEVRRHRDLLYCGPRSDAVQALDFEWAWRAPAALGVACGSLRAEIAHGSGVRRSALPPTLRVRTRSGGERLRLPGRSHHREVKKLLQEANVLPWWRDRLPLVYAGETLIAVADLWIAGDCAAKTDEEGVRFVWDGRPRLEALVDSSRA